MKLLSAMGTIDERIVSSNKLADSDPEPAAADHTNGKTGIREVDELHQKLAGLDHGEKRLLREMEAVQREMLELTVKYKKTTVKLHFLQRGVSDG